MFLMGLALDMDTKKVEKNKDKALVEYCGRGNMNSKMVIAATMPVEQPFATRITPPEDLWERMKLADYIKDYQNSNY